ncbi:uncharacterized protein LOC135137330 [Zophobas morio]|uniref:uncharacterized protein LOC135137330 n=1 Tax=Zophobas morio TaxID=2755281 RepID=UPI0030827D12
MLALIKYKIILFVIAVTSLTICALIICVGALDVYADVKYRIQHNQTYYSPHRVAAISMFSIVNISIFANIVYMSIYALRGLRYTWYMGCNYFLYVLSELISAVIIVTEYDYLNYSNLLAILVFILAVFLFIITLAAEQIFNEVEELIAATVGTDFDRVTRKKYQRTVKMRQRCVTISLRDTDNQGPSTSGGLQKTTADIFHTFK